MKKVSLPSVVANKPLSRITNKDVQALINGYKQWLSESDENISWSDYCRSIGINNPYRLKDYLIRNFTGLNNTVDVQALFDEVERIREDKLIKLGIFNKDINANFLLGLMKSRFGWHENTVVVGISVQDIMEAKRQAEQIGKEKQSD